MSDRAPQVAQPAVEHGPMNPRLTARRPVCVAGTVLVLAATLVVAPPASRVGAAATTAPVPISGVNPLPAEGTDGRCSETKARAQDWETDNELVADPARPGHLVTAWIQDFMDAIVVGYSTNGGRSWKTSLPKTGTCTWELNGDDSPPTDENDFTQTDSSNDPSIAMGPSPNPASPAITYLTSIVSRGDDYGLSATIVNTSTNGGRTWSDPVVLDPAEMTLCSDDLGCVPTVPPWTKPT